MNEDESYVQAVAAGIVKNSRVRSFPEDYVHFSTDGEIEIPVGTEIIMFRQDENVVVAIDGRRLYLRTYDDAKYIFYSAKRGQKYVHNPAGSNIQDAIKEFEEDLDHTSQMIDELSREMSVHQSDVLRMECSRLLGYSDIF